jgi:translation initiation factor 2 subunit 2
MEQYEKLLDSAYKNVKQVKISTERFEVPKVTGLIEGTKTILTNFFQICDYLRRDCDHLIKFLSKELATQIKTDKERIILNTKVSSQKINSKIEEYVYEFIICKECGKPDTEIIKQDRVFLLHCLACGAKHPIRSKIQ